MYKKEQATKHANFDEEFQARAALELERGLAQDAEKRERMRDAARQNRAALQDRVDYIFLKFVANTKWRVQ